MTTELFVFAGRRPNMELQMRWVRRVLDLHPDVTYTIWNLAREPADAEWLPSLHDPDNGITVRSDFVSLPNAVGIRQVWAHYLSRAYRDAALVKVDDDVVFLDAKRFWALPAAARKHPDTFVSADVVNNGACDADRLSCPPLETFKSSQWAAAAHGWFFTNWQAAIAAPIVYQPQEGWVSINAVALMQPALAAMLPLIGQKCVPIIAGHRHLRVRARDESAVNLQPRAILRGVMAAHLSFGPQNVPARQLALWRKRYAAITAETNR